MKNFELKEVNAKDLNDLIKQGNSFEEALTKAFEYAMLNIDKPVDPVKKYQNIPNWNPDPYKEMIPGEELMKELSNYICGMDPINEPKKEIAKEKCCDKECKCEKKCEDTKCYGIEPHISNKVMTEFENDLYMWTLQLKAFVLDALCNKDTRNSQAFIDFLDEMNKISVCF